MNYPFPPDVAALVQSHLSSGKYSSADDVLRVALQTLGEQDDDLAAIQEALDLVDAGDEGIPLEEAVRLIRDRHR